MAYGWGGVTAVSRATGMSQDTIRTVVAELAARESDPGAAIDPRLRRSGGGRKQLTDKDAELADTLDRLVDSVTRGDSQSPLRFCLIVTERLPPDLGEETRVATLT